MRYSDSHIHSSCSSDGHNTMHEMALASYKKGVDRVCFTDHVDIDHYMTGVPDPQCFDVWPKIKKMYRETISTPIKDIAVRLGIELGEANHNPQKALEIASAPELDFVLGSLHNLRDKMDFYELKYNDEDFCSKLIDDYLDELIELAGMDCFDVMAHIGYPIRYTRRAGFKTRITMESHGEKLELLLKKLIENGKGIEINCAGFRNPILRSSVPTTDILKCYKRLGGEIITVGSDAHRIADAGSGLPEGFDILRNLGYKYVTVFESRKPIFQKI